MEQTSNPPTAPENRLSSTTEVKEEKHRDITDEKAISIGRELLESNAAIINELDIVANYFENSGRTVRLIKVLPCYHIFKDLVSYYAINQLIQNIQENNFSNLRSLPVNLPAMLMKGITGRLTHSY